MKIAILGDLHFGCRNDSRIHQENQRKFFEQVLFPTMESESCSTIFQLGDFMDRRKFVSYQTLNFTKEVFMDVCERNDIKVYALVGNHDIYYRDSLAINSLDQLFPHYTCLESIQTPTQVQVEGISFDFIPWICEENEEQVMDFIEQSDSEYALGHFDIVGFDMLKGIKSEHGLTANTFSDYQKVWSGHYHTRSMQKNIEYLGTPYEITWSDVNDEKGFLIFDTETREEKWFVNNHIMFGVIYYDNGFSGNLEDYQNCYLKVVISSKESEETVDQFIEKVYQECDPVDLSIIDTTISYDYETEETEIETRDPLTILTTSVPPEMEDGTEIKTLIHDLYVEVIATGAEV